jgi:hypothetical protein
MSNRGRYKLKSLCLRFFMGQFISLEIYAKVKNASYL